MVFGSNLVPFGSRLDCSKEQQQVEVVITMHPSVLKGARQDNEQAVITMHPAQRSKTTQLAGSDHNTTFYAQRSKTRQQVEAKIHDLIALLSPNQKKRKRNFDPNQVAEIDRNIYI